MGGTARQFALTGQHRARRSDISASRSRSGAANDWCVDNGGRLYRGAPFSDLVYQRCAAAREEFGGVSANDAIQRLLDERWEAAALSVVQRYREDDPQGWVDYLAEAEGLSAADAPITDEWRTH